MCSNWGNYFCSLHNASVSEMENPVKFIQLVCEQQHYNERNQLLFRGMKRGKVALPSNAL